MPDLNRREFLNLLSLLPLTYVQPAQNKLTDTDLPNILVIGKVLGTKKTLVFCVLVESDGSIDLDTRHEDDA